MATVYDIIRDAIVNKKVITAYYQGHRRLMCPHAIGTKRGRRHALFYQFGGTSSRGPVIDGSPRNWRCMDIDDLRSVSSEPGEWHTADNHARPQTCIDYIDVEADY
ncbi:hypothetical protein [Sorangium sp. So ce1153]|uniref:hypothetical protein n=1 Tax=Sorangium sp. So ce1153 TaxID=3133333 RepID=UPI003F5D9222